MKNLIGAERLVQSLREINTTTLTGKKFINESISAVASAPFSMTLHMTLLNEAHNIKDKQIINWAANQVANLNKDAMGVSLQLLCESTIAGASSALNESFKSTTKQLLKFDETDLVRKIAIDGALDNYNMYSQVKAIIQSAKAITQQKLQSLTADENADLSMVKIVIGFVIPLNTNVYGLIFDDIALVQNVADDTLTAVNVSNFNSYAESDNIDTDSIAYAQEGLSTLLKYYNEFDKCFTFNLFNDKIVWSTVDHKLYVNDVEQSLAQVNAYVTAKSKTVSLRSTEGSDSYTEADMLLPLINSVYSVRDFMTIINTISCVNTENGKFYIGCGGGTESKFKYYTFVKYAGQDSKLFQNTHTNFADFAAQFMMSATRASLAVLFADEIADENAFELDKMTVAQLQSDTASKLQATKQALFDQLTDVGPEQQVAISNQIQKIDDKLSEISES